MEVRASRGDSVNTPAHQLPTIKEGSTLGFRFSVGTWCAIIGSIGTALVVLTGGVLWLSTMHDDVQSMKAAQARQAETLNAIRDTVREIEFRQKYGITAGLPSSPRAAP